jgi:NADH:ubiquinone oxidoreductase subunit K
MYIRQLPNFYTLQIDHEIFAVFVQNVAALEVSLPNILYMNLFHPKSELFHGPAFLPPINK